MEQVLVVDPPEEVVFLGPLSRSHSVTVALTNTSQNNRVMFKMKTTSRKSYFVRPNGGFISPGATQHVQINLQKEEYPEKRHKFMVEYSFPPPDLQVLSYDHWKTLPPEEIMKYIIRVKYEQPPPG